MERGETVQVAHRSHCNRAVGRFADTEEEASSDWSWVPMGEKSG